MTIRPRSCLDAGVTAPPNTPRQRHIENLKLIQSGVRRVAY